MKIGILTYHRSINCGAVIQCYSLCNELQNRIPNAIVEVIDYHMPLVDKYYDNEMKFYFKGMRVSAAIRRFAKKVIEGGNKWEKERKRAFEEVRDILPLSPDSIYENSVEKLFEYINSRYDVVVAGSDAIWNYNMRGFPNPYYLSDKIEIPKLSYAASCHGMDYKSIPLYEKEQISKILQSYQFLGVRDDETYRFAKWINPALLPAHTCDPTVFLNIENLPVDEATVRKKLENRGFDFAKKTIGLMGGYNICSMIRKMFGKEYQIVSLFTYCRMADVNLYDLTPYEWAYIFRYFALTFTTYFHGMLLSLRNGIPVICTAIDDDYSNKYKAKVPDFLERINMQDCYFNTDYQEKNYIEIKEKAIYFMNNDTKDQILNKMNKEAETVEPFITQTRKLCIDCG